MGLTKYTGSEKIEVVTDEVLGSDVMKRTGAVKASDLSDQEIEELQDELESEEDN